jgi:hypothetical protein
MLSLDKAILAAAERASARTSATKALAAVVGSGGGSRESALGFLESVIIAYL